MDSSFSMDKARIHYQTRELSDCLSFRISAIRRSESESYAAEVLHLRLGLRYRHLHDFCVLSWLG